MSDNNGGRVEFSTGATEEYRQSVREALETSESIETDQVGDDELVFWEPDEVNSDG